MYDHKAIERKWRKRWEEEKTFRCDTHDFSKPKFYALDMFPFPSGQGLHVGHPEGYTASDIVARMKRMQGYNVLHPMGWDAFGLPAEQYAIEHNEHPEISTRRNIDHFREQIKSLGMSIDWDREISTIDPSYYKWTQWIFCRLFEHDLAYLADVPVNFCPELGTVLANEEVIDGKSERGGYPVVRIPMRQWMLRITRYADRLEKDLEGLDWPRSTIEMQKNWIGRSTGVEILYQGTRGKLPRLHHQGRHPLRLHLLLPRPGAPSRQEARDPGMPGGGGALRQGERQEERSRKNRAFQGKDRGSAGDFRDQPHQREGSPGLRRRLCPRLLRDGRRHGGSRA